MHGIQRHRDWKEAPADSGVARIVVRYTDGRELVFIPDARAERFSEDDILQLKNVFDRASSAAEWAELAEDPSRRV